MPITAMSLSTSCLCLVSKTGAELRFTDKIFMMGVHYCPHQPQAKALINTSSIVNEVM